MTRHLCVLALVVAVAPAAVLAAGPQALSLKDGAPAELLGKTLAIARGLFALALVVGLAVEAFGGSPDRPKNYGGVVWRSLVVLVLLGSYSKIFGTVIVTAEAIAERIAPDEVWDRFAAHTEASVNAMTEREQRRAAASTERGEISSAELLSSSNFVANYVGGAVFDTLVSLAVMLGQAFQWVFGQLSRILLALFYVVGPLALVFYIPGASRTASKWFSAFVTIASWPILSAILLAIATSLMYRTNDEALNSRFATAFGAVASSLLIVVLNVAVPILASAIVGGAITNVASSSIIAAMAGARTVAAKLQTGFEAVDAAIWRVRLGADAHERVSVPASSGLEESASAGAASISYRGGSSAFATAVSVPLPTPSSDAAIRERGIDPVRISPAATTELTDPLHDASTRAAVANQVAPAAVPLVPEPSRRPSSSGNRVAQISDGGPDLRPSPRNHRT